jgi:uncharacterized protein
MSKGTFLITGASDGIGAVYADRLAKRGYDLVLVARRADKLDDLAARLRADAGVNVETLAADLGASEGLAAVEQKLRDDAAITGLVNNAGIAGETTFAETDVSHLTNMINLNILAVTRLAAAITPRLAKNGGGVIINVGSVLGLMPGSFSTVYPATKAFVLALTEGLKAELAPAGVRVQAVLPGATKTPIWTPEALASMPPEMVMDADEMVDAALTGFDLGETITIPSLPENADLDAFIAARAKLQPNLSRQHAAARYQV